METGAAENDDQREEKQRCRECGGAEFERGDLKAAYGNPHINFYADVRGFFQSAPRVRARRCTSCGHLSLFANI